MSQFKRSSSLDVQMSCSNPLCDDSVKTRSKVKPVPNFSKLHSNIPKISHTKTSMLRSSAPPSSSGTRAVQTLRSQSALKAAVHPKNQFSNQSEPPKNLAIKCVDIRRAHSLQESGRSHLKIVQDHSRSEGSLSLTHLNHHGNSKKIKEKSSLPKQVDDFEAPPAEETFDNQNLSEILNADNSEDLDRTKISGELGRFSGASNGHTLARRATSIADILNRYESTRRDTLACKPARPAHLPSSIGGVVGAPARPRPEYGSMIATRKLLLDQENVPVIMHRPVPLADLIPQSPKLTNLKSGHHTNMTPLKEILDRRVKTTLTHQDESPLASSPTTHLSARVNEVNFPGVKRVLYHDSKKRNEDIVRQLEMLRMQERQLLEELVDTNFE